MNATSTAQACVMRAKSTCSAEVLSTGSAQSSHGMTPVGPGRHMPYEWCTFGRAGSPASGLLALLISVALLAEAAAGLRAGAAPGDSGARAASTSSRIWGGDAIMPRRRRAARGSATRRQEQQPEYSAAMRGHGRRLDRGQQDFFDSNQ